MSPIWFSTAFFHWFLWFRGLMEYIKKRGRVLHHWSQTLRYRWKHSAYGLVLSSVSGVWNPWWSMKPEFWQLLHYCQFLHVTCLLKLINYSRSQKPINDDHLGQMDESWHLTKHQIKYHQVFICMRSNMLMIWDQTLAFQLRCFIRFYWLTQLVETTQYQRKCVTA